MALEISELPSLAALGEGEWNDLAVRSGGITFFQTWAWLDSWWQACGNGRASLVLCARHQGRLVGAAALCLDEATREIRFIGDEHADYQDFVVDRRYPDATSALVHAIRVRCSRTGFTARLSDIRIDRPLALALDALGVAGGVISLGSTPCPRLAFARRPASEVLRKESIRRHEKRVGSGGQVVVRHLRLADEIAGYLPAFFAQHVERWSVTPTPSLFAKDENRRFYRELAARASPTTPVRFCVVERDGRPIAMHFGFESEGDLVWYKPSFDLRLHREGPGEVLLAALVRHASEQGLAGIDFTRGGESFKRRFATEERACRSYEIQPGRGRALRRHLFREIEVGTRQTVEAAGLGKPISRVRETGRKVVGRWRDGGVLAVLKAYRARAPRGPVRYLELYAAHTPMLSSTAEHLEFRVAEDLGDLLEQLPAGDPLARPMLADALPRFRTHDACHYALRDGVLAAFGWATAHSPIPVVELGIDLGFGSDVAVLYDFHVADAFRGQGYYSALLRAIRASRREGTLLVYATDANVGSQRGIEAAGFVSLGRLVRDRTSLDFVHGLPDGRLAQVAESLVIAPSTARGEAPG